VTADLKELLVFEYKLVVTKGIWPKNSFPLNSQLPELNDLNQIVLTDAKPLKQGDAPNVFVRKLYADYSKDIALKAGEQRNVKLVGKVVNISVPWKASLKLKDGSVSTEHVEGTLECKVYSTVFDIE